MLAFLTIDEIVLSIDLIKKNTFGKDDTILFNHSGGSPALYAHTDLFDLLIEWSVVD